MCRRINPACKDHVDGAEPSEVPFAPMEKFPSTLSMLLTPFGSIARASRLGLNRGRLSRELKHKVHRECHSVTKLVAT